jgi:crotonyl-CoA reductase
VHRNVHQSKVGVLALAPEEGLGVRDTAKRAKHLDAINLFREAESGRSSGKAA